MRIAAEKAPRAASIKIQRWCWLLIPRLSPFMCLQADRPGMLLLLLLLPAQVRQLGCKCLHAQISKCSRSSPCSRMPHTLLKCMWWCLRTFEAAVAFHCQHRAVAGQKQGCAVITRPLCPDRKAGSQLEVPAEAEHVQHSKAP